MFHRWVWEQHKGPIPDGYEIDHICFKRGYCTVEHIHGIPKRHNIIKTKRERKLVNK
ncbi:HNH endonuclease signature motif containing protein [Xylella fastidiosa]|uniref:HNH endonuclease signature motif containing protein n=1 Tax=Xylella fastidiosa TaxID=2371 RepID=UPI001EEB47AE|nr:HNH endonuclease signature motif containing protein [Xylella fastidiosa]